MTFEVDHSSIILQCECRLAHSPVTDSELQLRDTSSNGDMFGDSKVKKIEPYRNTEKTNTISITSGLITQSIDPGTLTSRDPPLRN
jgi:hypothetical protein